MQKFCNQFLRRTALLLTLVWCIPAITMAAHKPKQPEAPPPPLKVTILATAGVNGHILDWEYQLPKTVDFGLVKAASIVKKERQNNFNTILLDGGNMFSGTELTKYFASTPSTLPNPMVAMYNSLGYDAVVLGDGEFAYGADYLSKSLKKANFSVLAANTRNSGKSELKVQPYIIKEITVGKDKKKEKIRIGIIGVSNISPNTSYDGLTFNDPDTAISNTVKKIQKDVNAIIILKNDGLVINGVTSAAPGKFGTSVSKTELTFEKVGKKWWITHQTEPTNISTVIAPSDTTMSDAIWPYHDATLQKIAADKKAAANKPANK